MADAGVELIEGRPRFVDPHTLEINGRRLRGGQIVIATGQRPRTLDLPGAEHAIDSDGFLEIEQLPERLAFVGGGYIAMEFAGVAAVAGARVTVVESGTYPLKPFDRDAVRTVLASLTDLGVRILTQRKVTAIEPGDNGAFVVRTDADTAGDPIVADRVVNASGRVPSIDGLGLEEVGIAFNKQGIEVDASLRSVSHRHVWAAGDVAANGRAPLTPTAAEDGQVVAHNLLHDGGKEQVRTPVSSVAFTLPSIGSVGMSEDEARETFDSIEIVEGDMSQWKHFRQQREPFATYKLVFCDQQKLRGAHLVGADCEEVINLFALAICQECDKQTLLDATLGYPTVAFSLFQKFRKHRATKAAPQDCGG
jgi:glutathione reductase (NADPH)